MKDIYLYADRISVIPDVCGINGIQLVGKFFSQKATTPLSMHNHGSFMEICYLYKGKQTYYINNNEFNLCGGDIIITYPEEIHGSGNKPEEKSVLYWLQVDLERNENFAGLSQKDGDMLLNSLRKIKSRMFKASGSIKPLFEKFINTYISENNDLRLLICKTIITSLLIDLVQGEQVSKSNVSADICSSIDYIKQNINTDIQIEELSQNVNLSKSRFKQKFKLQTGMPPKEFIWREKIENGKIMLLQTDVDITSIAIELGFSSSQYFSSIFKKFTYMSPSEYRKSKCQ